MKPETLLRLIIRPTLSELALYDTKQYLTSREAEVLLLAIAIQESSLQHRRQIRGPARSFWQIEPPTYKDTLLRYTPLLMFVNDLEIGVNTVNTAIDASYAMRYNDALACACARGILRLNPKPLPDVGDEDGAWDYYLESWRPGKPRPGSWHQAYEGSLDMPHVTTFISS